MSFQLATLHMGLYELYFTDKLST